MSLWQLKSKRKKTGGLLRRNKKKKKTDRGTDFLEPKIGERKLKKKISRGSNIKLKILSDNHVNLATAGKVKRVKIESVVENPANPNFVRRNIITKGCIVKTEAGNARITSRVGRDGILNAVLVEK